MCHNEKNTTEGVVSLYGLGANICLFEYADELPYHMRHLMIYILHFIQKCITLQEHTQIEPNKLLNPSHVS